MRNESAKSSGVTVHKSDVRYVPPRSSWKGVYIKAMQNQTKQRAPTFDPLHQTTRCTCVRGRPPKTDNNETLQYKADGGYLQHSLGNKHPRACRKDDEIGDASFVSWRISIESR